MKKKNYITIILVAGMSVTLLSNCSKEADLPSQQKKEAVITNTVAGQEATVLTSNKDASVLIGTFSNSEVDGWSKGDSICIYTLQSMRHNSYLLTNGEGSPTAAFKRCSGTDDYANVGTLYAVTSCKYLYGLSATVDGQALLTVDIPSSYDIAEVGAVEECSRLTAPYWGEATFGADGNLKCAFSGLTAMLKIDIGSLPVGTRAVVLTTHRYTDLDSDSPEGGDDQPLSGTFDTVLNKGAALAANPIFYSYDTLRVNLGSEAERGQYKNMYLPVIAGQYTNLHIIAVTGDTRYPYNWEGTVIQSYKENTIFRPNNILTVGQSTSIIAPRI